MKKLPKTSLPVVCICILLSLAICVNAAEVKTRGQLSDTVYCTVYDDNSMVVEGTGEVPSFSFYSYVTSITVMDGITGLGESCFENRDITYLELAGSVKTIGKAAMRYCEELTEVVLHEGVEVIGESAFQRCTALQTLPLPSTLTTIETEAFRNTGLTEIVIPASVTQIGDYAFYQCEDFSRITFLGGPPEMSNYLFQPRYDSNNEEIPMVAYYPDDGSWGQKDLDYYGTVTKWIPYTLGANGEIIPDESRAYTAEPKDLSSGEFMYGGSWRIEEDVLYISGEGIVDPWMSADVVDYTDYWDDIRGLVVEDGVTEFSYYFTDFEKLEYVVFPDSLRWGCNFIGCPALKTVELGGLQSIKGGMFDNCDSLTELVIPASVISIGQEAIALNQSFSIIFLGDAPIIADNAFRCTVGEVEIFYPSGNATWTEAIFNQPQKAAVTWVPYKLGENGEIEPDYGNAESEINVLDTWSENGIEYILYSNGLAKVTGSGCLDSFPTNDSWRQLTRIEIGEGITSVDLVLNVDHEQEVTIQLPSTLTTIEQLQIDNVKTLDLRYVDTINGIIRGTQNEGSLETVLLSGNLTTIPDYCFAGEKLKSILIPDSVTSIGISAFEGCHDLAEVQLGSGVQFIGERTFFDCGALAQIVLPAQLRDIGGDAFSYAGIQEVVIPKGVEDVKGFENCPELVRVTLSEGVRYIWKYAFAYCAKLESINIPDSVEYIEDEAFWGCESLKSFDFNNAHTNAKALDSRYIEHLKTNGYMPQHTFWSWEALKTVELGGSGAIDSYAFTVCPNLETVILGDGITYIAASAFVDCPKLTTIDFNNAEIATSKWNSNGVFSNCGPNGMGPVHVTFPKVERIPDDACDGWFNLETAIIPEGVELIGMNAFDGCSRLKTVVLPDSLKGIGDRAFYRCSALESISFGPELEVIEAEAFAECYNLKDVTFRDNHVLLAICRGAFYRSGITAIDIPDSVVSFRDFNFELSQTEGAGSWMLGNNNETRIEATFGLCEDLATVHLPENLKFIPAACFEGCEKLESANIPNACEYIGEDAFARCESLKMVTFGENLEEIQARAFYRCRSLESALMQDKVLYICEEAFAECANLTDVRFSPVLFGLGDGAFYGSGIKEAILPDTFQTFTYGVEWNESHAERGVFAHCENLEKVVLHSHPNLNTIPANTFSGCSSLRSFTIPDSVRTLGAYSLAFTGLTEPLILPEVQMVLEENFLTGSTVPAVVFRGQFIGSDVFMTCPNVGVICYYPAETPSWFRKYLNYPHWRPYTVNEAGEFVLSEAAPTEADIAGKIEALKLRFPEGYPCDQYSSTVLNTTGLSGYGSQAFAYIISDELFDRYPAEAFDTVRFADVQVGDILRIDNDSRAVVVVNKTDYGVEVVQGDWNGTVHWDEFLTVAQVEAADYRISRYGMQILNDVSAIPEYEPQFRTLATIMPTEEEAYRRIRALESSFPQGFPFTLENLYALQAENQENVYIGGTAQACCAFANMASDIAFGTVPMYEKEIRYEDIMVGDLLYYDPNPDDMTTHIVTVLEVYSDCVVVAEGNIGEAIGWGRVISREEVETMISRFTRYPEDTVAPARSPAPKSWVSNMWWYEIDYASPEIGTWGENITWTLENGVLTISGQGAMKQYDGRKAYPWMEYEGIIRQVVVKTGVTTVSDHAFASLLNLEKASIGEGVTQLGMHVFSACENLTEVELPGSLKVIGADCFLRTGIRTIELPAGMETIGAEAFLGSNLTEIVIPDSVSEIGADAFSDCPNLKTAVLSAGCKILPMGMFRNCAALQNITIPEGVTTIGWSVFEGCRSLQNVTLPESLSALQPDSFADCTRLTRMVIPAGVKEFVKPFGGCTGMKTLIFQGNAPVPEGMTSLLDDKAFVGVTATVYYPAENDTWTETVLQDYGGNLTWVAYELCDFNDASPEQYYYNPVLWAVENGVTTGTGDGTTFSPDRACTRGQVVTFLWRAAGCPEPQSMEHSFTDVKAGSYYEKAVIWAVENGITSGKGSSTTFQPDTTCNRSEVVTFLWRAKGKPTPESSSNPFPDVPAGSYYEQAVLWAVENGITTGKGNGNFAPTESCTRAHVVTFLYRAFAEE